MCLHDAPGRLGCVMFIKYIFHVHLRLSVQLGDFRLHCNGIFNAHGGRLGCIIFTAILLFFMHHAYQVFSMCVCAFLYSLAISDCTAMEFSTPTEALRMYNFHCVFAVFHEVYVFLNVCFHDSPRRLRGMMQC